MKRWMEFLEGENQRLSVMRLLMLLSFFPASAVLLYIKTTEALGVYLTAYVANSIGNKFMDVKGRAHARTISTKKP